MAVSRRTVTVLFTDVADSTRLGERLDPEALRVVMTRWFDAASTAIERHGGTVEKFIGDAVMGVFGVPEAHEDDAVRAIHAASELRERLARLNAELERQFAVTVAIRIGVNTGEVVAGDTSAGHGFVSGDAVNTAKRLEESAAAAEILIGEQTERLVRGNALLEPADPLAVKGKSAPVAAWRLLAAIPGMPPIARRSDTPLVGRQDELARLRRAYERAVYERVCYLFTLLGSAGIGKSRLAAELFDDVGDNATVLIGRCLPYGDGITFWPLTEILHDLDNEDALAALLGDESELVYERLCGITGRGRSVGAQETFWAVRKVCEALARQRPVILCFEDVHWAEPTLLDLIEYLAGWMRDSPVLLLCLARPEFLDERPAWLSGQENAASVTLSPLSSDESRALVEALGVGRESRARIAEAAEGNPLYLEQLAAMVAEDGTVDAIPPTIQALLAARLDRLNADERAAIEHAAVCGKEFWRDAVTALADPALRPRVGAALMSLVRKELIRPHRSSARADDAFRFGHALIRDAAYTALPKQARSALHERFAEWCATNESAPEEIVGYHLEQAFRYREELGPIDASAQALAARAGRLLAQAGRRAFAGSDMPAAVNLLARSIALLSDDDPDRRSALSELGSALMRTGDFTRADDVLTEALELAAAAGDKRLELRTLIEREFFRTFTNPKSSTEELIRIAESAIPLLEQLGDELGLAKAWWLRSEADVIAGRWGARAAALERALTYARRAGDSRDQASMIDLLAQALLYGPTPVPEAIRRCEQLRAIATDERAVDAAVDYTLGALHAMEGRFDEARDLCERARARYEELGLRYLRAVHSLGPAYVELLADNAAAAVDELYAGYEALERMGERGSRSTIAAFLARALVADGRYSEAETFSEISEESSAVADVVNQAVWRCARARCRARAGHVAEGERLAREAVELAAGTDFLDLQATTLLDLAEVLRLSDDPNNVAPLVEAARERYERKGNVVLADRAAAVLADAAR